MRALFKRGHRSCNGEQWLHRANFLFHIFALFFREESIPAHGGGICPSWTARGCAFPKENLWQPCRVTRDSCACLDICFAVLWTGCGSGNLGRLIRIKKSFYTGVLIGEDGESPGQFIPQLSRHTRLTGRTTCCGGSPESWIRLRRISIAVHASS